MSKALLSSALCSSAAEVLVRTEQHCATSHFQLAHGLCPAAADFPHQCPVRMLVGRTVIMPWYLASLLC